MKKKKKQKKSVSNIPNQPQEKARVFALNWISPLGWSNASVLVSFIAFVAVLKNDFYKNPNPDPFLEIIRWVTPFAVLIITVGKFTLLRKTLNSKDPTVRSFWLQIRFVLSIIVLALVLLPIIYQSGFPKRVFEFLSTQISFLGLTTINFVTKITALLTSLTTSGIGNIILGVIGNFISELIKKMFTKKKVIKKTAKS